MFKNFASYNLLKVTIVVGMLLLTPYVYAQNSWLHDITLYSDASKEKVNQVLGEFGAIQARNKKLGEEYLGAEYYHFEIESQRELEFLQRLRAIGEYTYDLRESFLTNKSHRVRFVVWHYRKSFPTFPNVFRVAKKILKSERSYSNKLIDSLDRYTQAGPVVFEENPDWDETKLNLERLKKQEDNARLAKCQCDLVITWSPNPVANAKVSNVRSRSFSMQKSELKNFISSLVKGGTTKIWKSSVSGKDEIRVQFINAVELKSRGLTMAKYLKSNPAHSNVGPLAQRVPSLHEPKKYSPKTTVAKKTKPEELRGVASAVEDDGESVPVRVVKKGSAKAQATPATINMDMSQYVLRSDYEALLAEVHKLTLEIQAMKEVVSRIRPTSLSRVPIKPGTRAQGGVVPSIGPVTTKSNTTTTTTTVVTTTTESTVTTEVGKGEIKDATVSKSLQTGNSNSSPLLNQAQQQKADEDEEQKQQETQTSEATRMPAQESNSPIPEVKVNPALPVAPENQYEEGIEGTTIEYLD